MLFEEEHQHTLNSSITGTTATWKPRFQRRNRSRGNGVLALPSSVLPPMKEGTLYWQYSKYLSQSHTHKKKKRNSFTLPARGCLAARFNSRQKRKTLPFKQTFYCYIVQQVLLLLYLISYDMALPVDLTKQAVQSYIYSIGATILVSCQFTLQTQHTRAITYRYLPYIVRDDPSTITILLCLVWYDSSNKKLWAPVVLRVYL